MVYVMNVNSLTLEVFGVNHVMLNIFNKISKTGPVKVITLMNSFKMHNSKLEIIGIHWNGSIMIDLKMLNIWPKVNLKLLIKQFGKMDIYLVGILKIINGKDIKKIIEMVNQLL